MSTSIISLDQNFNANDVDIIVFEPYVLFSPAAVGGWVSEYDTWSFSRVMFRSHMSKKRIIFSNQPV